MKIQNRNRAMLLALAGGYVLYLAYEILRDQLNGGSSMELWVCILIVAFFAVSGIAVLLYAWKVYRTKDKEESGENDRGGSGSLK